MNELAALLVEQRIRQLLVSDLEIDPERLTGSAEQVPLLGRGIGLDSVEALALALGLEREFDLAIPDEDLTVELFANLATLADYVRRALAASGRG